jgi:hypothetical protein
MDFALGVLVLLSSLAAGELPRDGSHVRTMDPRLRSEINEGLARSSFFRQLIARLDASDVIVYVQSRCAMPHRIFGRLAFMGTAGGRRYVHVLVSCALMDNEQVAALGHELRHAVEIAEAPSVVDTSSLGAEYQRIGYASHGLPRGSAFESHAAVDAAHQVWAELSRAAE